MRRPAPLFAVGLFTLLYLVTAATLAYQSANWEFVLYIVVVLVLGSWAVTLHYNFFFPPALLWALSLWGLMHMLGGLLHIPSAWVHEGKAVLYSWWIVPGYLKYDHVVHAYGFAVVTWGAWRCLLPKLQRAFPTAGVLGLCVFVAMGAGALNELIEFAAVKLLPDTNVGGYDNTGWDLVSNTVGSLGAALWIWLFYHHPPQRMEQRRRKA